MHRVYGSCVGADDHPAKADPGSAVAVSTVVADAPSVVTVQVAPQSMPTGPVTRPLPVPRLTTVSVMPGVPLAADDAAPAPDALTARNLTVYAVPLVRPARTSGDVVDAGLRAIHSPSPPEVTPYS